MAEVVPETVAPTAELVSSTGATPRPAIAAAAPAQRTSPGVVLMLPAILLCIVAALSVINSLVMMVRPEAPLVKVSDDPEVQEAYVRGRAVAGMARSPIVLVLNLLALAGSVAMMKREKWGLALAGAIISVLPFSLFCLGTPIGIWSLIVLNLPRVKAQFH